MMFNTLYSSIQNICAWRPFLDPLPVDDIWLVLLVPMVIAIAVVYKTIKTENIKTLARDSVNLSFQIGLFMVAAAVILLAVTSLV